MGTRADFYLGRGEEVKWLGSIAWDGYPDGLMDEGILESTTEDEFMAGIGVLSNRDDFTSPSMGWPWPWDDSGTTDYAYAFEDGFVWTSCFGSAWYDWRGLEPDDDFKVAVFPLCGGTEKNVNFGNRSGVIFITSDA